MNIDNIISSNVLPAAEQKNQQTLGKDDFLKLMLIQMRNQDPLNPMDNQAMASQMAQFTSLEQMSNLNKNITESNASQTFMQATHLLGKEIEILDPNASPDSPGTVSSKVKSVRFSDNGPVLSLENGLVATVDQILHVSEASTN